MPPTIRMGFIGAGPVAQAVHLPILCRLPQIEPLVLCDSDESALQDAVRRFGVRETTTRYQDVLKMQEVDAVLITLPNNLHARVAEEALRAGKHVLCEKPAGLSVGEALAVKAASDETGRVYMLALPHRFDAESILMKRWMSAGHLGNIYHVRAGMVCRDHNGEDWLQHRSQAGGGAWLHFGTHLADLILWFLDFPAVARVSAASHEVRSRGALALSSDVEDSAFVLLRMAQGLTATVETAWTLHCNGDRKYLEVYGDRSGASLWPLRLYSELEGVPINVTPTHGPSRNYQLMAEHFVECILAWERGHHPRPMGNADDGLRLAYLTHFIYQSATANREVEVASALTDRPAVRAPSSRE